MDSDGGTVPVARVTAFSDGVFAFAMTLLAVELVLPSHEQVQALGEAMAWAQQMPLYIAFVFSFLVTAMFWVGHLDTWKHAARATPGLLWLCILQLMGVVLMPIATTAFAQSFVSPSRVAFMLYCSVLAWISFLLWQQRRLIVQQPEARAAMGDRAARWFELNARIPMLVFLVSVPLALVVPSWVGSLLFTSIWPLTAWAQHRHRRRVAQAS